MSDETGVPTESVKRFLGEIKAIVKKDTYYLVSYLTGEQAKVNVLNSHVYRYHMSPDGEFPDYPEPDNPKAEAKITVKSVEDYGLEDFKNSQLIENESVFTIDVKKILIIFDKVRGTMTVKDKRSDKIVLIEKDPLFCHERGVTQTLLQHSDEFFFGGGMQNGRFTHKEEIIDIVNTNKWDDGGVTSPCPFYWSNYGYGILRNTWTEGVYDFGHEITNIIATTHKTINFDAFYFINSQPRDILKDYYELTGHPILMPEYSLYEAHLNTFNRDYWVKVDGNTQGAILFEDGVYYKCYQPSQMEGKKGVLESLNGEKNNYQFSARAMIDRYKRHDLPLGWFVPNDGYGSGYGQTDSLDGDIANLQAFGEYARDNGVELAVWTESNLHPADPEHPKKGERDLNKEVSVAGVVALKADVAWIGSGYSFGLSAMQNAADTFLEAAKHAIRPMIITVDGWAGTQRCARVWSGDQSGGLWEYIRFHIPTYIGSGLSGQPIVGSDMDGIYRGGNKRVNIRDFQWKAFTPLQLNMDGWGRVQKSPFAFDEEATSINRAYLKLKSMLMPYNYTLAYEAVHGLPMIRAMALEFPDDSKSFTKLVQYQFMWGPNILVAPVYNEEEDAKGNSIRNGIYLPNSEQVWIDFVTGEKYQGGKVYNNILCPLWKIPVFVKDGAIVPYCNPNNNPKEIIRDHRSIYFYPNGESSFDIYEDDGISTDYLEGHSAVTHVKMIGPKSNTLGDLQIIISKVNGTYDGIAMERTTELIIMASTDVYHVKVAINGKNLLLKKVKTKEEYDSDVNVYYFDEKFVTNRYLPKIANVSLQQTFLLIKLEKTDVMTEEIHIQINGFTNKGSVTGSQTRVVDNLEIPSGKMIFDSTPTSITLDWNNADNVIGYEIEVDNVLHFSNINKVTFNDFKHNSEHSFRLRAVTENGVSNWSDTVTASTKDPYKNLIRNVKVSCTLPCEKGQEICNLITLNMNKIWHTNWGTPGKINVKYGKELVLDFEFDDIYEVEKFEYVPRLDAGNGTLINVQYKISSDGLGWGDVCDVDDWDHDSSVKTVYLNGLKFRFMKLIVQKSIGNFGSGRAFLFYHKP